MKIMIMVVMTLFLASCNQQKSVEVSPEEKLSTKNVVETTSIKGCNYTDEDRLLLCAKKGDEESIYGLINFYLFD
jgi:uncharacterized lipoprotein YajG